MNVVKSGEQISMTKIGLLVFGIAQGIISAGINIVPSSTVDETILKLCVVVGGVLAGIGARDAIAKVGK
jgi:hypothetical protein